MQTWSKKFFPHLSIFWIFFLTALLSFYLIRVDSVNATYPCADGYYCVGTTVVSAPLSCVVSGKSCKTNWGYQDVVCEPDTCKQNQQVANHQCSAKAKPPNCYEQGGVYYVPTNCCAKETGATPTPEPPTATPTPIPVPSCTVNLWPNSASLPMGPTKTSLTADVTNILNGTVSQVNFSSGNTGIATVSPASDTSVVYLTEATGVGVGSTTIRAGVIMSGAERCFDTSAITVTPPGPWWQVVDSDVTTNGDIVSRIYPAGAKFILDGPGGYPGVAVYGAQAVFGNGVVSSKGWLANTTSTWLTKKIYDYKYFREWLPSQWWNETTMIPPGAFTIVAADYFRTEGTPVDGYLIYYHSGDLTINATQNMQGQRAVLFVDGGDLTINKNISLDDGTGFFMAIVGKNAAGNKGNILIDPAVASLEGFYTADNLFKTGAGNTQLKVRGSAAGLGGITLQRDLGAGNTTTPAELFEYAPDLVFTYPSKLAVRKMRWKEVAP